MKKQTRFLLLCVFLLCVSPGFAADSAPPWLQTAAQQTVPHFDKDIPAVILWDEGSATVNDKGQIVKHMRFAVKILTKEGKEYAGQAVHYNTDSKVLDFTGWYISPDGKVKK